MRDFVRRMFVILCVALCASMPALAAGASDTSEGKLTPGAPVPGSTAMIVDVQRVLDESLAAKSVQKQLESQRAKFQTEIEKEENELSNAEKDLNKSRDTLAPDAFADREQQLRQRFLVVERHVQARRKSLDQAFSDSMNTVHAGLLDIVKDVAREHHANLVLIKQQILWADRGLDGTDEVLSRLNAKLPTVAVKMPAEDESEKTSK